MEVIIVILILVSIFGNAAFGLNPIESILCLLGIGLVALIRW